MENSLLDKSKPEKVAPKRERRIVVDELRDVSVQVLSTTVVFRPGQVLSGHLIPLARENNIQLREV